MSATGEGASYGRGKAGFTLLEMLVVLAIAGLIGGLAFPALDRLAKRARFDAFGAEVALAVRGGRAEAIRQSRAVGLYVPAGGRELVVDRRRLAIPEGLAVAVQPETVTFFADGTTNGGAVVVSEGARRTALEIARPAGLFGPTP